MTIATREQLSQALDHAERLVAWLSVAVDEPVRQLLATVTAHLAFVRRAVADGRVPLPDEKAAIGLAAAAGYFPASLGSPDKDQALGWLRQALPEAEQFFRSIEPPRPRPESYALGTQVTVRQADGSRLLGFIRCPQEASCLVAFASGGQQWLDPRALEPAPQPGEAVAVAGAGGWRLGTVVERVAGSYQVDTGEGRREWFDWAQVAAGQ
jgi:hypothetical protein